MTTLERAQQLSDATFLNIETALLYLFATPIGWTFWGVLAFLVVCSIHNDAEERHDSIRRSERAARLRAEQEQRWKEQQASYRSPAGYNHGVKTLDRALDDFHANKDH